MKGKKIWSRSTKITSEIVSKVFSIHNGKDFIPLTINEKIIGTRLGEYARTRKRGKDPRIKVSARRRY